MVHKLRAALSLSWDDWRTFFQSWVLLLAADLSLRLLPFARVQKLAALGRRQARQLDSRREANEIRRLERIVDIATRNHLYPLTCLRQSLTLQWLLARRGIDASLRIGVRKEAGELQAHAWVEYAGRVIGEGAAISGYAPLVKVNLIQVN